MSSWFSEARFTFKQKEGGIEEQLLQGGSTGNLKGREPVNPRKEIGVKHATSPLIKN